MARTTILLEDNLLLEVKQLARANRKTVTEVIREALRATIQRQRRRPLPSFTAIGKSGRRSVSKNSEAILRREAEGPWRRDTTGLPRGVSCSLLPTVRHP